MKKDKLFLSIIFLALCLLPPLALASYPVSQYPYVPPIEKMQQNGTYIIFVEKEGKWHEATKFTNDMYFREKAIDLSGYISGDEKIRIKIMQKGGGAAHIDSVFLGEKPPVEVVGVTQGLVKLSRKDFDVIDSYGRSIEMAFLVSKGNNTLKLTARVEGATISKNPFQFPLKNLFKNIDKNSQFFSYRLNSQRGSIKMDGVLDETANLKPLFSEYYPSGSGHPSGFTYGWVWNDDENLYVAIDFTPDNTMDGEKDYAKIYVNTEDGLKEFKVSVPDTHWGRPAFTYTSKVGYQHKVYEFKVPFKEILKRSIKNGDELQLAFSTYGTAAAVQCEGDLKTYSVYYVDSGGAKNNACAAICFDDGTAFIMNYKCGSPFGILAAEVGGDGDFGKDKYNYVGKIDGNPCHLHVWDFKGSYFELDCFMVDDSGFSFHVYGERSDCTCTPPK